MKIKWKVQPAPTGRYRSFKQRGWPIADYENGKYCASISCDDSYDPRDVKAGTHGELTLSIADHSQTPWKRRTASKRFKTLQEAKDALPELLKNHPHFVPKKED